MSGSLEDKLGESFQSDKIEEAFWKYKAAKHDVFTDEIKIPMGADGISYETFEKELSTRCKFISNRVLKGTYLFYPFREVNVPKPSGQERVLAVATIRDVLVQKILYEVLYSEVEKLFQATSKLDRVSCAYRKGKSAPYAAKLLHHYIQDGFHFALDADIVKFFDLISHERLILLIENLCDPQTRLSNLLRRFIKTSGIPYRDDRGKPRKTTTFHHYKPERKSRLQGIPQGGVLSGMLANLYLHEFDRWIVEDLARQFTLRYVRYADDFVILFKTKDELPIVHGLVEQKLSELKLQLHPILENSETSKTKYVDISKKSLIFLGFEFTPTQIKVSPENVGKFKNKIIEKIKKESQYKFLGNPQNRLNLFIRNVINKKIKGRNEKICPVCQGRTDNKIRNWIGFFSVVTDTQQLQALDKWIRTQVSQHFYKQYKIRLKRADFRKAGLASITKEYYKTHKLKKCSCKPLNIMLILKWVLLTGQFRWLEEAIAADLGVEILRNS